MKTCCPPPPELPEFYENLIILDIQDQFEHALVMIRKCKPQSPEFDFYLQIIKQYARYTPPYPDDDDETD